MVHLKNVYYYYEKRNVWLIIKNHNSFCIYLSRKVEYYFDLKV